jgi:RNA polymerase sigma-70 factor (ECF subfamily)
MARLPRIRPNLSDAPGVSPSTMQPDGVTSSGPADFDETFRESYGRLVRGLTAASGDAEAAADAVQDAFVRAYARWRRISRYEDPVGWVRHVALNRLRDHFRRVGRRDRAVDRLAGQEPTSVPAPEEPSDVGELLDQLPAQQRIATALFYVDQLSVREVSTAMRISEGAVKYHLHAARSSLRERLEQP